MTAQQRPSGHLTLKSCIANYRLAEKGLGILPNLRFRDCLSMVAEDVYVDNDIK